MYGVRGLGLNCPGDPGCDGYVAPGSSDYQTSLLQEILANQVAASVTPAASPNTGTVSAWLNTNATMIALGAAAFLGLVVVVKAGR
jgi:hypothetical protein